MNEIAEKLAENNSKGLSTIEIHSLLRDIGVGKRAKYTPDEIRAIFEYYQNCMVEINRHKKFPPTKRNFCAFCGISTAVYDRWILSNDPDRAEIMKQIDDYISDVQLTSAQNKEIDNITTLFRAKSEHGLVEAQAPIIVEHRTETDFSQIQAQIDALKKGKSLKTIELGEKDYEVEE